MSNKPATGIDLECYVPFLLSSIANRWTATSSRLYLTRFGIGIVEWRVLVAIDHFGQCTAQDSVTLANLDAGAASRAVRSLEQRDLIQSVQGKFAGRSKPYRMTTAGCEIHAAIRDLALIREDRLLNTLTPAERARLVRLLGKVHANLGTLQADA